MGGLQLPMRGKQSRIRLIVAGIVVLTLAIVAILGGASNIRGTVVKPEVSFPSLESIRVDADTTNTRSVDTVWKSIAMSTTAAACTDWVTYHSNQQGNWDIFRMDGVTKGTVATSNMTANSTRSDISPARSPDSEWIAFASDRDGNWEIYVSRVNGADLQRVTFNTWATEINPVWSPDGKYLMYESTRNGNWDLYMATLATGEETRLTTNPANDSNAFWSPDSQRVIFQSDRDEIWQIYDHDVATQVERALSDGSGEDFDPSYSPDGTRILFSSNAVGSKNSVITIANADGSNRVQISDATLKSLNAVWSSDGAMVAYQSEYTDKPLSDIYVYDVAMGIQRPLTANSGKNYAPTWMCGTSQVVFTSDLEGNPNLFLLDAKSSEGSEVGPGPLKDIAKQLTSDSSAEEFAQNSPGIERGSRRALIDTRKKPGKQ